jgi:hypothetical protein
MLQFELMALDEVVCILVILGNFGHSPMIGASIFEFGLAFLDARFLDLEFG